MRKKKILVSLLISPLAFSAFGFTGPKVVADNSDWTANGVLGGYDFNDDGTITMKPGTAALEQNFIIKNPGEYKIEIVGATNCVLWVDDKKAENGVYTLTTTESNKNVKLKVDYDKASETYTFKEVTITFEFDYEKYYTEYSNILQSLSLETVAEDDKSEEANNLRTEYETLSHEKEQVEAQVEEINTNGSVEQSVLISAYSTYEFYKGKDNKLAGYVNGLKTKIEEYNVKVAAEDKKYDNRKDNEAAMAALLAEVEGLQQSLDEANDQVTKLADGKKEYVEGKVNTSIAEIQAKIDEYKAAINDAYNDPDAENITAPESQVDVINASIDELNGAIESASTAYDNYQAYDKAYKALKSAYLETLNILEGLKGVEGYDGAYENVYNDVVEEKQDAALGWFNSVTPIKDADQALKDWTDEYQNTIQQATEKITEIGTETSALASDQNKKFTDVMGKVNAIEVPDLPEKEAGAEACKDYRDKVENLISDLKEQIVEDYKRHEVGEYTTDFDAIDAAINTYQAELSKWTSFDEAIRGLQSEANELDTEIEKLEKEINGYGYGLSDKFTNNIGNLKKAADDIDTQIDALTTGNYEESITSIGSQIDNVMEQITATRENANTIRDAIVDVETVLNKFKDDIDKAETYIGEKKYVEGVDNPVTADVTKALNSDYDDFDTAFTDAKDADYQACYTQCVELKAEIVAYRYKDKVAQVLKSFESYYSQENIEAVQALIEKSKSEMGEDTYVGYDADAYKEFEETLNGYQQSLNAANGEDPDLTDAYVEKFSEIDTKLVDLFEKVKAKAEDIQKRIADQEVYDELDSKLKDLQGQIDDLSEFNENTSNAPAQAYYKGVIDGYTTKYNEILSTLEEYLNKIEVVGNKVEINTLITNLANEVMNTKNDIIKNEAAYNAQLVESSAVLNAIIDAIEHIKTKVGDNVLGSEEQEQVDEWIDSLKTLQGTNLINVDRTSYNAYGEGKSVEQNGDIMDEYDGIFGQVTEISEAFDAAFGDLIKTTNQATVKQLGWPDIIAELNTQYANAINAYNAFYGLTNTAFKKAMTDAVGTHSDIFQYVSKIRDLDKRASAWIGEQTETFTVEQFKDLFVNETNNTGDPTSTDLSNGMTGKVNAILKKALDEAESYYRTAFAKAETTYNDAVEDLVNTGVFTEDEAEAALNEASECLDKGTINLSGYDIDKAYEAAQEVQTALGYLETISAHIKLSEIAKNYWDKTYNDATDIKDCMGQKNANYTSEQTEELEELLGQAEELNTKATSDKDLLDNLKEYVDKYESLVAQAEGIFEDAKAAYEANKENNDLKAEYASYVTDFNDQLDALKEYIKGLASDNASVVDPIEAQIKSLSDYVEANSADLTATAVKSELKSMKEAIEDAFTNAYYEVVNNEYNAITDFIKQVEVAFNNAKTKGNLDEDVLDQYNEDIEKAPKTALGILKTWELSTDEDKNETYKVEALKLEKTLSEIYVVLENSYDDENIGKTLGEIKDELQGKFTKVENAIKAVEEYLAGCDESVQTEYGNQVTAIFEDLEGEKTAWEDEGDRLVMTYGNYLTAMEAIAGEVKVLKSDIEAAQAVAVAEQAKKDANEEAYASLSADLTGYTTRLSALETKANEYNIHTYDAKIKLVKTWINAAQNDINAKNDNVELTADSKLKNASAIESTLIQLTYSISHYYAESELAKAQAEVNIAEAALTGNIVPSELEELRDELNEYKDQLSGSGDSFNEAEKTYMQSEMSQDDADAAAQTFDQVGDTAKQLIETVKNFVASIDQYRFFPGDVNGSSNGEITIADLQMIINWVGDPSSQKGMTAKQFAAADLNGDCELNIADVTAEINLLLNQDASSNDMRLISRRALRKSDSMMSMVDMGTADGVTTYAINLRNTETFVAGQFDIVLDGDLEIVGIDLASRAAEHELYRFDNTDGTRLIIASMDNAAIADNDGAVVYIQVSGTGSLSIDNALFAEGSSATVEVKTQNDTSFIDTIYEGAKEIKEKVYNVAGQALRSLQRGINVIIKSDGTSTKEMHK